MNLTVTTVTVPLAASRSGHQASDIGFLLAMLGVLGLLLAPSGAGVANRFGRRTTMVLAFALSAAGGLMLAGNVLALGLLLNGLAAALFWPAILSQVADTAQAGARNTAHGLNGAVQAGAALFGATISPYLVAAFGAPWAFGLIASGSIIGVIAALGVHSPAATSRASLAGEIRHAHVSMFRLLASRRLLLTAAFAWFPFSLLWWVGGTSFLLLFAIQSGNSPAEAGLLISIRVLIATAVRVKFRALAQRLGILDLIVFGTVLAAVGIVLPVAMPTWPVFLISAIFLGAGLAVIHPAANTLIDYVTEGRERPIAYATPVIFGQAALLIGPPILGVAGDTGGYGLSLVAAGIMATLSALAMWLLAGRQAGGRNITSLARAMD